MSVTKFAVLGDNMNFKEYDVKENANCYSPLKCPVGEGSSYAEDFRKDFKLFCDIAVGCIINNRSRIDFENGEFVRVGEPTEAALKVFAEKVCGMPDSAINAFDTEKKFRAKI